jgi:hypothetical protein
MIGPLENLKPARVAGVLLLSSFLAVLGPVPALAGQSVNVTWQPNTNNGVVGYNVYYGTKSQVYTNKLSVGNLTATNVSGLVPGATYYFAATSFGASNQESAYSQEISYAVPAMVVLPPPAITSSVPTTVATVGKTLAFKIKATGSGSLTYSLAADTPAWAWINPTNGMFVGLPQISSAGTTNVISVIVTENGDASLSTTQSFSLTVQDYINVSLGSTVVAAGSGSGLGLSAYASTPVTNLEFYLNFPPDQLTNLFFTPTNPLVGPASVTPTGPGRAAVAIGAVAGQALAGAQGLGVIGFNAAAAAQTQFAWITASAPVALKPDGTSANFSEAGQGRVVIVGQDSLLEPRLVGGVRNLIVYGPIGTNYQVESCNDLGNAGGWSAATAPFTMTNLALSFQFPPDTNSAAFYRTRQLP